MPRFEEVKKFHKSYYQIYVGWDYLPKWLAEQESNQQTMGNTFELNPDFQRGHVWTEDQQIAYVEFVIRGGDSGLDVYFNHPGWRGSYKGDMVCVDGLQRITAVQRFMNGEIPAFGHLLSEYEDPQYIRGNCHFIVHVSSLKTKADVLEWYLELNTGGVVHSDEELDRVRQMLDEQFHYTGGDA